MIDLRKNVAVTNFEVDGLELTRGERFCDGVFTVVKWVVGVSLLLMALGSQVDAQSKKEAVLLADETTMTELAASVKITTSNEKIFSLIVGKFGSVMKSYSVKMKRDRAGEYKEYSIPFKKDVSAPVIEYVRSLGKK